MKWLNNAIIGFLGSIISYAAVLFGGISISYLLGYVAQSNFAMQLGFDYLIANVVAGMLGGYVGGNNRGFNGALVGGVIAGAIAAGARLLYVFFA